MSGRLHHPLILDLRLAVAIQRRHLLAQAQWCVMILVLPRNFQLPLRRVRMLVTTAVNFLANVLGTPIDLMTERMTDGLILWILTLHVVHLMIGIPDLSRLPLLPTLLVTGSGSVRDCILGNLRLLHVPLLPLSILRYTTIVIGGIRLLLQDATINTTGTTKDGTIPTSANVDVWIAMSLPRPKHLGTMDGRLEKSESGVPSSLLHVHLLVRLMPHNGH